MKVTKDYVLEEADFLLKLADMDAKHAIDMRKLILKRIARIKKIIGMKCPSQ